uniref:Amine oxidase n=1 Tax=Nannospalax galili TaxID=1026970 RepID=A0A8C6RX01_NANGA
MDLARMSLALGWMAAIFLLQMSTAERFRGGPDGETQVFADMSAEELESVHAYLMNREELELQPARTMTLAKNCVFLIERLLPRKHEVLDFLDKGTSPPLREARVLIYFGAQEHPNVTEYAVGPIKQPVYMRKLNRGQGQELPWASRPMSKVESALLHDVLKEATEPLNEFFFDTTGYTLQDCNGQCLTFTNVAPHGMALRKRHSWFIMQLHVEDQLPQPTGLEILVDHGSTNVQNWRILQLWYNSKLYQSAEELARKYKDGEVDTVDFENLLPKITKQSPTLSYKHGREYPKPISKTATRVLRPSAPHYSLKDNTVLYGGWTFFFHLRATSGLQIFNVHFKGERIAYEISAQAAMALYGGQGPEGTETKYINLGWGLGGVIHQLVPGIDCPDTATFVDAIYYYDSDDPVHYPQALCIFEMPTDVPLGNHFNSNFRDYFNHYESLKGHMLVLRTTSAVYNYDYIWDYIFYPNGVIEAKMHATGRIHTTFYTPEGQAHGTHLHDHLLGNIRFHLVHYRVDLDVAGTKNSFQTAQMRLKNKTNPWSQRSHQVKTILHKTQYSRERQAAFRFTQTLPKYLLFSSTKKNMWGPRSSYRLQVHSPAGPVLPQGWQKSTAFEWFRYQLAVTKYQESERFSNLVHRNHHWAHPVTFEDFIQNDDSIEDKDLVAWITTAFLPHFEDVPSMAIPKNYVGFLLQPFDFVHGIK